MKAEIHPAYGEITVTCSCGSVFKTQSTLGRTFTWRYAPSATPSTPASRKFSIPLDA